MPPARLFLYLASEEFVRPWVWGGSVPLFPASTYRSSERVGTLTPDENRIHDSPVDLLTHPAIGIDPNANIRGLTIVGNTVNGRSTPDVRNASYYSEDGLVLCLSTKRSQEIARRLHKVACVRIIDVVSLKLILDKQIGCKAEMALCEYTHDHRRNHFLKSTQDAWQREFRLFWKNAKATTVRIPRGAARRVPLEDVA